jgi:hypothetical protein
MKLHIIDVERSELRTTKATGKPDHQECAVARTVKPVWKHIEHLAEPVRAQWCFLVGSRGHALAQAHPHLVELGIPTWRRMSGRDVLMTDPSKALAERANFPAASRACSEVRTDDRSVGRK